MGTTDSALPGLLSRMPLFAGLTPGQIDVLRAGSRRTGLRKGEILFHRVPRSKLIAAGGIERYVVQASYRVTGAGGVLVLIDADDDCPATMGPSLRSSSAASCAESMCSISREQWWEGAHDLYCPSLGCRLHRP